MEVAASELSVAARHAIIQIRKSTLQVLEQLLVPRPVPLQLLRSYCRANRSSCCLRCSSAGRWFFVRILSLGVSANNADGSGAITTGVRALAVCVWLGIGMSACIARSGNFPDARIPSSGP